MLNEELLLLKI